MGRPQTARGTAQVETDPHTGIGRKKDGEAADRFGHKEQRLFRASDGSHGKRKNASSAVMVGGYYAEGATDFYTTAERRGTALKKGK